MPLLARRRRGVTLVETLIVLTILGVVGGAIFSMLSRQQRFYRDANETITVRRELRLGASLLPMDARGISTSGGDVLQMQTNRFTFRATIGSGIACQVGATSLVLPPTNLSRHTLTSWYTPPVAGDTIFVFDEDSLTGAEDDKWRKLAVSAIGTNTAACVGPPYAQLVADAPALKPRWQITVGGGTVPATVRTGAVVRITRPVRYELYQAGSGSWYLGYQEFRAGSWSVIEPVAGPFRPPGVGIADGVRFAYYDTLGAVTTNPMALARVDVALRAQSAARSSMEYQGQPLSDSLLFRIGIRNIK